MNHLWMSAAALLAAGALCRANVQYDPERNCLWVTDFPAAYPCDMARLAAVDAVNGWGKIRHDPGSDTWMLDADLWIGTDDGTDTYFQLGDADHPTPTLIVNGHLVVCPSVPAEPQAIKPVSPVNRFTMGHAANSRIRATLQIRSDPPDGHSVFVGVIPHKGNLDRMDSYSGQFYMFHSRLTAAVEDDAHRVGAKLGWGAVVLKGDSIRLKQSTIAWVKAVSGLMVRAGGHVVEDMLFEHCGTAISGYWDNQGHHPFRGCTFRQCGTALSNPQARTVLVNCTFVSNDCNWQCASALTSLTLTDCEFDTPLKGDRYAFSADLANKGYRGEVTAARHVVLAARDADGNPLKGVVITVRCDQTGAKEHVVTGADGKTPGREGGPAVLLTVLSARPVAGTDAGETRRFSYAISAAAAGYEPAVVSNYYPLTSWSDVGLTLRKR